MSVSDVMSYRKKMSQSVSASNTSIPETLYLQLSTFIRPIAILSVLIAISIYVNREAWLHLNAWEYCAFAAFPLVILVLFLLRKHTFIRLDNDFVTVHYVTGTEHRFALREITKVGVVSFKRPMPSVVLRLRDDSNSLNMKTKAYRAVSGYDVILPPFMASAKYLASRIEEARLRKGAPVEY